MEVEILTNKENKLLRRKEIIAKISHINESTPKRLETRDKLAASVNADAERTVVVKIDGEFGRSVSQVEFRVYDDANHMKAIEFPYILKRNGFVEEEK
jgi:small subunit ribosomal protein S24e